MSKDTKDDLLEQRQRFETGSERQALNDVRYDLISSIGLKRLAQTYAEGALKYGDRNWEKGQPFSVLLNHARDHINDFIAQQQGLPMSVSNEDHLAHAAWNLFAIMHFQATRPKMNDLSPLHGLDGEITPGKIDTSKLTAMEHPDKHAFQGEIGKLCEACKKPSHYEIHYQGTERIKEGE